MTNPILVNLNLDAEGFMTDKSQWTKEVAEAIAQQEGIESLTESHWKIIEFCRKKLANKLEKRLRFAPSPMEQV